MLPLALALGLLPVWCTRSPRHEVQVVAARRATLRNQVATNGTVEPVDDIEVRARLDGRVIEIVDAGKHAQAGDEIVRFDGDPVTGELAAAESDRLATLEALRAARASAAQMRERAAVDAMLYEKGGLTREAYEASRG